MATDLAFLTGTGGASRAYTPAARKADNTLATPTDTPIIEISGPALGTPTDTSTPDISQAGVPFSVISLLKGAVVNLLAIQTKLLAGIGVTVAPNGLGPLSAVPAPSNNGAPIGSPPVGKRGVRIYVPPGCSISFGIAGSQPSNPPTTITVGNPSTNSVPANWDEDLAAGQQIYVTAVTGSVLYRWY